MEFLILPAQVELFTSLINVYFCISVYFFARLLICFCLKLLCCQGQGGIISILFLLFCLSAPAIISV